jgi:hypothetical protein
MSDENARGRGKRVARTRAQTAAAAMELMTTPKGAPLTSYVRKIAILLAKLRVTGACFWYVSRQIDLNQVLSTIPLLDFRWAAFAILVAALEIPLSGLRWYNIVGSLAARDIRAARTAMIAATAVGVFFAQVLPSVAGDGVRAWLLVRLGSSWHNAVTSVVIDRRVGVGSDDRAGIYRPAAPVGAHCAGRISRPGNGSVRSADPRWGVRFLASTQDRSAAQSVAIFTLVRNVDH